MIYIYMLYTNWTANIHLLAVVIIGHQMPWKFEVV